MASRTTTPWARRSRATPGARSSTRSGPRSPSGSRSSSGRSTDASPSVRTRRRPRSSNGAGLRSTSSSTRARSWPRTRTRPATRSGLRPRGGSRPHPSCPTTSRTSKFRNRWVLKLSSACMTKVSLTNHLQGCISSILLAAVVAQR